MLMLETVETGEGLETGEGHIRKNPAPVPERGTTDLGRPDPALPGQSIVLVVPAAKEEQRETT
jgi:hypothetical protein